MGSPTLWLKLWDEQSTVVASRLDSAAPDGPTFSLDGPHLAQTARALQTAVHSGDPQSKKGARSCTRQVAFRHHPLELGTLQARRVDTAASTPHSSHDGRLSAQGRSTSAWSVTVARPHPLHPSDTPFM